MVRTDHGIRLILTVKISECHLVPKGAVDADLSKSTRTRLFQDRFPDRFFNIGIAEQNMVGVAAGLALRGLIPFTNTFAFVAAFRSAEQIRTSVAYPNLNVKVVGHTGGLSPAFDGPSHQENADLAVMRALPNMTVVVPADAVEAARVVPLLASMVGPVYLRLCRNAIPDVFAPEHQFRLGVNTVLREGRHVTLIAMGVMLGMALEASA
jgi:transketolase